MDKLFLQEVLFTVLHLFHSRCLSVFDPPLLPYSCCRCWTSGPTSSCVRDHLTDQLGVKEAEGVEDPTGVERILHVP